MNEYSHPVLQNYGYHHFIATTQLSGRHRGKPLALETFMDASLPLVGNATPRGIALLDILWHERFLTRAQLIASVDLRLGKNCFGVSAWQDTFCRGIRFVKQAFDTAGYQLLFIRKKEQPGYYLNGQPALSATADFRATGYVF